MNRIIELNTETGREYEALLHDCRTPLDERTLERAYDIGRRSLEAGTGLLDLIRLHYDVVRTREPGPPDSQLTIDEMTSLLVELLTPFEMTHRGYQDALSGLRRVNERLENEARRIAHTVHDEAGQLLASVHLALAEIATELPPDGARRLEQVHDLLNRIEEELRRLSRGLRPTILDDLGLMPALAWLAESTAKRADLDIRVTGSVGGRLVSNVETALYRIAQEALNNIVRHSNARSATIELRRHEGKIEERIRDDGVGFDVSGVDGSTEIRGLGLIGMRERVAALGGGMRILSRPGLGTSVEVWLPEV
ncbi:MAG TPA: sensor histidine kinase [Vicinamibacterales bacterium]|nr:sensor histidine kinase [Vicinamibacterales bacterium]